jgi:hypothetical protein
MASNSGSCQAKPGRSAPNSTSAARITLAKDASSKGCSRRSLMSSLSFKELVSKANILKVVKTKKTPNKISDNRHYYQAKQVNKPFTNTLIKGIKDCDNPSWITCIQQF